MRNGCVELTLENRKNTAMSLKNWREGAMTLEN